MGDVIDFRNRKKVEKNDPGLTSGLGSVMEIISGDISTGDKGMFPADMLKTLAVIVGVRGALEKISHLSCSQSAYEKAVEIVDGYDDQQAIDLIKNSTELDWNTKPAFYKALLRKLLSNGLMT